VILILVLFAASRDALAKYYHRTDSLLGAVAEKGDQTMYNGIGHHEGSGEGAKKPAPESKPKAKSDQPPVKPASGKGSEGRPPK
jgi:hypothetical protein